MMVNVRVQRLQEQIKKELGVLLQQELKDPGIGFTTVTGVELSGDLKFAKVYISVMGDASQEEVALSALKRAQGFLRSELGRRIPMRYIPELLFKLDHSLDYGMRIEQMLKEIKDEKEGQTEDPAP
ncbi:MAG: Ribosome-binding factor A [Candidatus Carbobacillus altaicus]|uniref:Ribosome-binding factor A n=1 Tax=Candidatus Carbonibacillus altaicus TaxID=2163959 RepID=A0A2R6Y040_9BACL|nr:MAG: Ribosome-binding factor A [Candidatus Carbobacillus altaicus]